MKKYYNVYIILIAVLLFVQQVISGCTSPASKESYKKELPEEKFQKIEDDLDSKKLFKDRCSLCHELPDIEAYPYTSEQWSSIIDIMHDTKAARKFITIEEAEKIKVYLGRLSRTR